MCLPGSTASCRPERRPRVAANLSVIQLVTQDGWRRSMTSKPSPVSARLLRLGQSSNPPPDSARRRRVHTSGCTTIGTDRVPRRAASPARPPAWSKWPWPTTTACTPDSSRPSRSALMTIASGDSPVSNSTDVVVSPRQAVTSAEKPCSASSPTLVRLELGSSGGSGRERCAGDGVVVGEQAAVGLVGTCTLPTQSGRAGYGTVLVSPTMTAPSCTAEPAARLKPSARARSVPTALQSRIATAVTQGR